MGNEVGNRGSDLGIPYVDMTHRARSLFCNILGHWCKLLGREGHKHVSLAEEESSISFLAPWKEERADPGKRVRQ